MKALLFFAFLTLPLVTQSEDEVQYEPLWFNNYVLVINRYHEEEFKEGFVTLSRLKELILLDDQKTWDIGIYKDVIFESEYDYDTHIILNNLLNYDALEYFEKYDALYLNNDTEYHYDSNHVLIADSMLEAQLFICDEPEYFAIINKNDLCSGRCMGTVGDNRKSCLIKIDIIKDKVTQ